MTLDALITAHTSLPGARSRLSAEAFVITETISWPPGNSMTISELTAPCVTDFTLPRRTFLALIFLALRPPNW